MKSITREHIEELERAGDPRQTATLKHLVRHCHGDDRPDCPIIDEFTNPDDEAPPPAINARFGLIGLTTERRALAVRPFTSRCRARPC